MTAMSANAGFGVSISAGSADTDGQENEKSGDVGPETNKASFEESFIGGSIFIEKKI